MPYGEQRRYERMPFPARLTVLDIVTGQACEANSIDLSASGVQFYADRFLAAGTRVRIGFWLKQPEQPVPVELEAAVRWARIEQGGAVMGAEFDAPLGPSHCADIYEKLFARL